MHNLRVMSKDETDSQEKYAFIKACQNQQNLNVWYPILGQYGPALITQCENAIALSRALVSDWLQKYMFAGRRDAATTSQTIADYLANHDEFKTHGRHINRDVAKSKGLTIEGLETDQILQDLVLSIFHVTTHTFGGTGLVKIIENHQGKGFAKLIMVNAPVNPPPPPVPQPTPPKQ